MNKYLIIALMLIYCQVIYGQQNKNGVADPTLPVPDGITKYHALLIGNDVGVPDNDDLEKGLVNWNSWKAPNGVITKKDERTGAQIKLDITAWVAGIDGDDVAIFYYAGHGGIRADAGMDETLFTDPIENDNKRKVDEVMGKFNAKDRFIDPVFDDEIKNRLGILPESTTLIAIFHMCKAHGNALGTSDCSQLTNTAVLTACSEGDGTIGTWTRSLIKGMFDGADANLFADADANGNGELTAQELFIWTDTEDPKTLFSSNLIGASDRAVCNNLNNEQIFPGAGGGAIKRGEVGSGNCSDPDFGDAPDNGQNCLGKPRFYRTLLSNDGPRYNEWTLQRLGSNVDSEIDGQPNCSASGDDSDTGEDDEDGIVFSSNGIVANVTINHSSPNDYRFDAWFDLNDNGYFDEATEHIINSQLVYNASNGGLLQSLTSNNYSYNFAFGFDPRDYYSRFRLTFGIPTSTNILSYGEYDAGDGGSHGEVEDYCPINKIPTLDQWGLIILFLLLLTLGSVSIIRQRQTKLATTKTTRGVSLNMKIPMFNAELFKKIGLKSIPFIIGAITIISIIEGGLFARNIIGTIISGLIISYLVHFVLMNEKLEE